MLEVDVADFDEMDLYSLRLLCFDEKICFLPLARAARPALLYFDGKFWRQISNFHVATALSHRATVCNTETCIPISNHIMVYIFNL